MNVISFPNFFLYYVLLGQIIHLLGDEQLQIKFDFFSSALLLDNSK